MKSLMSALAIGLLTVSCCLAEHSTISLSTDEFSSTSPGEYYTSSGYGSALDSLRMQLEGAVHNLVQHQIKKKPICNAGFTYCAKADACVPKKCTEGALTAKDLIFMLDNVVDMKLSKQTLCPARMTFCVKANACVQKKCHKDEPKDLVSSMLDNILDRKLSKPRLCPPRTAAACVPTSCKRDRRTPNDLVNNMLTKFLDKRMSRSNGCPPRMTYCIEKGKCVPSKCVDDRRTAKDGLSNLLAKLLNRKLAKRTGCPPRTIFCVESSKCVPKRCLKSKGDLVRPLLAKLLTWKISKQRSCPPRMTYCIEKKQCVPLHCKKDNKIKDLVSGLVKRYLYQKHVGNRCPHGMTYCITAEKCVRTRCDKDEGNPPATFKDYLQRGIGKFLRHRMSNAGVCRKNTVYCLEKQQCVKKDCNGDGNGDMFGDIMSHIGTLFNVILRLKLGGTGPVCSDGLSYCLKTKQCVRSTCTEVIDKEGQCPAQSPFDVSICTSQIECLSDEDGCEGNNKCCENACGGMSCNAPTFDNTDGEIQAYKITAISANAEPQVIRLVGQLAMFSDVEAPAKLQFFMTTATPGCQWKKQATSTSGAADAAAWTDITDMEILDTDATIACAMNNLTFHGLTKVNVSDTLGNNYTLAVLIFPVKLPPKISLMANASTVILLAEDTPVSNLSIPVNVTSRMSLHPAIFSTTEYQALTASDIGKGLYTNYVESVGKLRAKQTGTLGVKATLANVTARFGTLSLFNSDTDGGVGSAVVTPMWNVISLKNGGVGAPLLKFEPEQDYSGNFSLVLFGWSGLGMSLKDVSSENVTFTVSVVNVNDAPTISVAFLDELQANPRSKWTELLVPADLAENTGILVSDAVSSFFTDPEGNSLGMCVIRAQTTDIGSYQYKPDGGSWTAMDVTPLSRSFEVFRPKAITKMYSGFKYFKDVYDAARDDSLPSSADEFSHSCVLLAPTTYIRFQPSSADAFWRFNATPKWDIFAWDPTIGDHQEGDMIDITLPFCKECTADSSPLSFVYVSGDAVRLGCHGARSQTTMVTDDCGKCGGDNSSCYDCHGVKDGGARWNQCHRCVLGTTGLELKEGVNCKGTCAGQFQKFSELDGACLPVDTDTAALISNLYCDGVWRSGAKVDSCGNCTGGNTNLAFNFARDRCGVCHGDDSTCLDCAGVPKGNSLVDNCGQCLPSDDPSFNTGCQKIGRFEPDFTLSGVAGKLVVFGISLNTAYSSNKDDVSCSLISDSLPTVSLVVEKVVFGAVDVITTSHAAINAAGSYSVRCTLKRLDTGSTVDLTVATFTFDVLDPPSLTQLSPNQAQTGAIPAEVVITGAGFVDTGNIYCYTTCLVLFTRTCTSAQSLAPFKAEVVDSTRVKCIIPSAARARLRTSLILPIYFSFSQPTDATSAEHARYQSLEFTINAPAPQITGAKFVGACKVHILFDLNISPVDLCTEALDTDSVAKLGTGPECFVRGSRLVIQLGTSSTLSVNDELTLKANAVYQRNSAIPQYASGSVSVDPTTENTVKFEGIKAPPVIGNCDKVAIRAKFQGSSCSSLTYSWSVAAVPPSSDAAVTADLAQLSTRLSSTHIGQFDVLNSDIVPGQTYEFSVHVVTHLREESPPQSVTIERKTEVQKLMIDLGQDIVDWDTNRDLIIRSTTTKSQCTQFELTGISYMWDAETPEFSLSAFSSVYAKIPGGTMRGGATYTVTVMATVVGDSSITANGQISISTASQPLQPVIARAPFISVGASDSFQLDARDSRDPDKAEAKYTYYVWSCEKLIYDDNGALTRMQPCDIQDPDGSGYVQFESSSLTTDQTQEVITIPGNLLDSESTYRFTLVMTKLDRSATADVRVVVQEASPPQITIIPLVGKHNPDKDLIVEAVVTNPQAFETSWSSLDDDGYESLEFEAFNADSRHVFDSGKTDYSVPLVIHSSDLKAGSSYLFQLSAASDSAEAQAQIVVEVNAAPLCSSLSVSPASGSALVDDFTAEVKGCDDDKLDFPLTFLFYVKDASGNMRSLSASGKEESSIEVTLEEGTLTFGATICDQLGACSSIDASSVVTVTETVFDTDTLSDIDAKIEQERATLGYSPTADAALKTMTSSGASAEVKQKGVETGQEEAKHALGNANADADPTGALNDANNAADKLVVVKDANSGKPIDDNIGKQLMSVPKSVAENLVDGGNPQSVGSRKKRAASEESTINAIDIETAEDLMSVQALALADVAEGDIEKENAQSFFTTLELVWQGLCAGMVSGQDPLVGKTSLLTFRTHKTAFDSLANSPLYVSCKNCTEVTTPATFTIGNYTQSTYLEWNCTATDSCYGGCLSTGQLNHDILTASSDAIEPLHSTRYSDIVAIHLINPSTSHFIQVINATTPISFSIPLTSTPRPQYLYMCRGWDVATNDWSEQFCSAAEVDNSTSQWVAQCQCFSTGYFGVFEGEEMLDLESTTSLFGFGDATSTTVNGTTVSANSTVNSTVRSSSVALFEQTTTPTNFLNDLDETNVSSVSVKFRIDANASLLSTNYSAVRTSVMSWLVSTMVVTEDRILNLLLTAGSIAVNFDLVPGSGFATSINMALSRLDRKVQSAEGITIGDTTYNCIVEPLTFGVNTIQTTTAKANNTTPYSDTAEKGLSVGVIIGIAVGCSLLVVLVIVIVAVLLIKKNSGSNKVHHSPRSSEAQLGAVSYEPRQSPELGAVPDYELKKTTVSLEDEALYGPAPVPHRPASVTKTAVPIGSRPSSTVNGNSDSNLTPVS